jgi:protein involved in polysaccharide export with SLBB domain
MQRLRRVGTAALHVSGRSAAWAVLVLTAGLGAGCASFTNPTAPDAIPVNRLPPEVFGPSREAEKTIPLTLLRQEPSEIYRLDANDVLGVFVEGVLGEKGSIPPLVAVPQVLTGTPPPPAVGFPVPVQEDGTLLLPLLKPIKVAGMTIPQANDAVSRAYIDNQLVAPGARILVSLAKQRTYHVTVIRQDAGAGGAIGAGVITSSGGATVSAKRGTGYPIDLIAYENDVLNALARTGGLPGLDASNTIVIQRGGPQSIAPGTPVVQVAAQTEQVRIPMRLRPNAPLPFKPSDVILKNGDIIFIESRDTEVYYTGGLLPVAELILPRDNDLDVLQAVTESHGPLFNGAVNFNNQQGNILSQGIGNPSPSLLTVIRKTPHGGQITIRVDLNRCAQDRRERILVQPGDFLILQETVGESLTRYLTQNFRYSFFGQIVHSPHFSLTTTATGP